MSYLKIILEIAKALPTIFDLWRKWEVAKLRREQDREAERRKQQIDDGISSGNSLPLEEAIGHSKPGRPSEYQAGVQTRPNRQR